jgi:hypothetical protein
VRFVAAGASKLAGCPDWDEFANGALRLFVEHGKFSHAQLDQIKHLRPRIKLSIALRCRQQHPIRGPVAGEERVHLSRTRQTGLVKHVEARARVVGFDEMPLERRRRQMRQPT